MLNCPTLTKLCCQVAGGRFPELLTPSLKLLASLREGKQFSLAADVDRAIGTAVQSMGPGAVLAVVPLQVRDTATCTNRIHSVTTSAITDLLILHYVLQNFSNYVFVLFYFYFCATVFCMYRRGL